MTEATESIACTQEMRFGLMANGGHGDFALLMATQHTDPVSIDTSSTPSFQEKLRADLNDFHLHDRALFYRHGLACLLLHMSEQKTPSTHHVLCVDIKDKRLLGMLPVADLQQKGRVESVEVFAADFSPDRQLLALAVGVVTGRSYMYMSETGRCFVVLFDVASWTKRMRIEADSFVTPSVAFDPCAPQDAPRMTVLHSDRYEQPMLTTYNALEGRVLHRSRFSGVELDGDTTTQLVYTPDGCFLILMALEDMWHDKTSLCRVFALHAQSLSLFHRYPASVVRPCHPDCVFSLRPEVQQCGTRFVIEGTRIDHVDSKYDKQTYNVPCPLSLRAMCRMSVLRTLKQGPRSASSLPLPKELQNYVAYKS